MEILFVAGFSPVVDDMAASKRLYIEALNLPLEGDYPMTEKLDGVKHFGLWSLVSEILSSVVDRRSTGAAGVRPVNQG